MKSPTLPSLTLRGPFIVFFVGLILLLTFGLQNAQAENWEPISSDKLVKLPTKIIEKRLEQDFNDSPIAARKRDIAKQIDGKVHVVGELKDAIAMADEEAAKDLKFNFIRAKSEHLDLLQTFQQLRQQELKAKQSTYQEVLAKLRHKAQMPVSLTKAELIDAQNKANARMEKVLSRVDSVVSNSGYSEQSKYATEYNFNLKKLEQLKQAFSKRQGTLSPTINGVEVTSEEYVRQLLMNISTEQSLLDQEALMLSYMAQLVALDSQDLEYELSYGKDGKPTSNTVNKTSTSADLYL